MREQGRPLSLAEFQLYKPYFKHETLIKARLIEGYTPFWLRKSMCAVVLGHRIYFRQHAYQCNTTRGVELLAHELTHVEQYLSGMNVFKYLWAARRGYRQNPYELEAYAKGAAVRAQMPSA
ncbi:MAG: DUF4157 domain-containing protein [Methylotenera sp.]|uniref:eCIS core domain-containing protein n=1 Tax=Methylotenera sp. TaxID=2051956 RepID=UPI0024899A36|nr:DUF4157 domain-containing protein [Methylotenera sp.]MDI1310358.1 DUF4157 domain-containing protein [Methylotenera sp.]